MSINRLKRNFDRKKVLRYFLCISFIFIISFNFVYGASDPTLVTKINSALKKILGYLEKISLPAAGVAIASGVLIRKFSFGSEEKMIMGKKIIINAILGYAIIISIDTILKFVDTII